MAIQSTPGAIKTSVGYETPQETLARANAMLNPTPTVTPKVLPTVSNDTTNAETAYTNFLKVNNAKANTNVDESRIYRDTLNKYQAQIDALNAVYQDKLNTARTEGTGRLGTDRAIQARSGLMGSDFGTARTDGVLATNRGIEGGIQNERNAALAEIYNAARTESNAALATKEAARKEGGDALIKYYTETAPALKTAKAQKLATSLITSNIDPSTLTTTEQDQLSKQWGVSMDDIVSAYTTAKTTKDAEAAKVALSTKKTEAEIAKINADVASGKLQMIGEGNKLYNTETGEVVAYNPKTYAPKADSDLYGGYTKDQNKKISSIDDKVSKNDTYKKTSNMRAYADNVNASLALGSGTGDLAAINQFQKVIDEGAVTRDQDVKLIQGSQSLLNRLSTYAEGLKSGQQLSPDLRSEMKKAVNSLYDAQVKALSKDPFITSKKSEAERYGIRSEDTILGELGAFSNSDSAGGVLRSPDGSQEVSISDLTPDELQEAKDNGWQ